MVVRTERTGLMQKTRLEGPADLVIEIVSDADAHLVYREKLPRYREAAIPEIWIVDPFRGEVLVDRLVRGTAERAVLKTGRLESTVVPGFWIEVDWLWRERLPSTPVCLDAILKTTGGGEAGTPPQ